MTRSTTPPQSDEIIDVAIIGGGVSGAYTAYRLMQSDEWKDKDIRLFEMSDRIGGRLWSIHLPGLPNLPAEMGGMAFSRLQCNVYGLCTQELELETKVNDLYAQNNLQYFRRHHFWAEDYAPPVNPTHLRDDYYPNVVPFFLKEEEKWKNPATLLATIFDSMPVIKEIIDEIRKILAKQDKDIERAVTLLNKMIALLREAKWNKWDRDEPLYEYGFWNVLLHLFSNEAYTLIKKCTPLHSTYGNCNLYDAFLTFAREYFVKPSYYKLTAGYDTLPKTLVKKFEKKGGKVHMQTQLFDLRRADYNGELIKLTVGSPTKESTSELYARYVVLALPQYALKQFDRENIIFDNHDFRTNLINTVTACPATKLVLAYDDPWWEQIMHPARPGKPAGPITSGFSLTDLPLDICYYVGKESTGQSLLIASLADSIRQPYWSPTSAGAEETVSLRALVESAHDDPLIELNYRATRNMVDEAQWQLKEMHGLDIPDPVAELFYDWENAPFGGGWHLWNPGVSSWQVAPKIRQPNSKVNVFVCGEAYSAHQGWVEGALNTAEMVLEEHFALSRPNWVPDNYDFGP